MSRQSEIREKLRADVNHARKAYVEASARWNSGLDGHPAGMTNPDGVTHLKHVGQDYRVALEAYMVAVKALSDFVLYGTGPSNREPPPSKR